jgi:hypothetical protein
MGTFSTTFQIPDLGGEKDALRLSSVVWSSQRAPYKDAVGTAGIKKKRMKLHPLVSGEQKLVPSVTRVFRSGQIVYAYAEAYDAAGGNDTAAVRASVSLFRGAEKVFESRPVAATQPAEGRDKTLPVLVQFPVPNLPPGNYTAQLTVIDPASKRFAAARNPLVVLAPARGAQ